MTVTGTPDPDDRDDALERVRRVRPTEPPPDDRRAPAARESAQDRVRREDGRVPYVEQALLAAQLGTTIDDLLLLGDDVVTTLVNRSSAVTQTIGASRLLERIDAHVAREHPVDLEYHGPITTATVPIRDDDSVRLALESSVIYLPHHELAELTDDGYGAQVRLSPDDAEALAHALLRLVTLARAEAKLNREDAP